MTTSLDPILITGCSTGIGRATAELLLRAGHTIHATARDPETLADLAAFGARVASLDVTDESSMRNVVDAIVAEHGRVGTLVNNAGYGEYGSIEETDLDKVRAMFETNVLGLSRMTQLVLPSMREAGRGRIINIGSMGGRFTFPLGGYYHATKHAVEALSDALRNEVRGFGIDVVLIEPGVTRSNFATTISESDAMGDQPDSAYAVLRNKVGRGNANGYANKAMSASSESVARVILKAVEAERPRPRYLLTPAAKALHVARTLGGDRTFDAIVKRQYHL